jgi:hypothetical protein
LNKPKTTSLFLSFILIAGTITAFFSSSSFTKEVHALSNYELMKGDYNSKYLQYNKENISCNNFNLNGNGLDVNTIPESLNSLLVSQGETDSESGISGYGTEENRFGSYDSKKDFFYKCINNNGNELIISPTPPNPPNPVDNVCTVWTDDTLGNFDIFFARSTDGGLTFSEPENISETTGNSFGPKVICEGNNVYVVWEEGPPGVGRDIFFARSTDGGLTFSEPENISETTGASSNPQISSEGSNVYVVWEDTTITDSDIFFARSTDSGLTFIQPENISETTQTSSIPQISSEDNNVYVVWQEGTPSNSFEIFFARSTDGGLTFSEPENISESTGLSFDPQISSEGNNVYVVWQDFTPGNSDTFFARSTDGGLTFSDPENISENTGVTFGPQITSEGNNVYVVWEDNTPGNLDTFFARSTDGGLTFNQPENISEENTGSSVGARISSEGNNVYVVWFDDTSDPNFDIFTARSTDGGLTFSDPENISENTGPSVRPQISSEGNNVYVVWQDNTPGNADIFFAASTDGGLTFSEPENLSENTGFSTSPQISSNTELQQQSTNDMIMTTAENNNEPTSIQNIVEQKEEQQLMEEQRIQDSPGLTALEKIAKLKQQWIELLP